jgi:predicted metal-dependent TIM-barrel fold hydrolase
VKATFIGWQRSPGPGETAESRRASLRRQLKRWHRHVIAVDESGCTPNGKCERAVLVREQAELAEGRCMPVLVED